MNVSRQTSKLLLNINAPRGIDYHTILRLADVKRTTGLSRSTIYLRIGQGNFPKPVSLGGRAVGWLEAEIQEWLQPRVDASRQDDKFNGSNRLDGG